MKNPNLPDIENFAASIPGVLYRLDISGFKPKIVYLNKNAGSISGYSAEDLMSGRVNWFDLVIAEDKEVLRKAAVPDPAQPLFSVEYRIRDVNGKIRWVLNRGVNVWVNGTPQWHDGVLLDITREKEGELALRRSEELLQWISRTAMIGGWELDVEKRTMICSNEVSRIKEVEPGSVSTLDDVLSLYEGDARIMIEKVLAEGISTGKSWDLELPMRCSSGVQKWIRDVGIPQMQDGRCVSVRGVIQDITEKKNFERALQLREEELELAISGAELGTWDWNVRTGQVKYNNFLGRMLGYEPEEFLPHLSAWENLVHPNDYHYVMDVLNEHLAGKTASYETEHRLRHKDGHWVWVLDRGRVVERDEKNNPLRACGTHLDISRRKEEELRNLELQCALEEFKGAISASSIVSIADLHGKITYANHNFEKISRYSSEELVGKNHRIVNSGYHPRSFWVEMWQTIRNGHVWRGEVKNKRKDGSFYWVDTFIMPLKNMENEITQFLSIRNDITEKKENEKKLHEALLKAEKSDRLKSAFIANISHEIRTPMNAVMGFAELLSRPDLPDSKRIEFSRLIHLRSSDLLHIVNDILDISRIEAGEVTLVMTTGNLHEFMHDLRRQYLSESVHLEIKNLPIRLQFGLLPEEYFIKADFVKLKQVLVNLLANAVKFTHEGFVEIGCRLIAGNRILFFVKDTGIGISAEDRDSVFKPFWQASEMIHMKHGGSGLGLAICKGLVTAWGGDINVESIPDHGSVFSFTVPFIPIRKNESDAVDDNDLKGKRILLLEDDLHDVDYITEAVAGLGMEVFQVGEVTTLISMAKSVEADVALVNTALAGNTATIDERLTGVPVIFIGKPHDRNAGISGALPPVVIEKPVRPGTIMAALRKVFSQEELHPVIIRKKYS